MSEPEIKEIWKECTIPVDDDTAVELSEQVFDIAVLARETTRLTIVFKKP